MTKDQLGKKLSHVITCKWCGRPRSEHDSAAPLGATCPDGSGLAFAAGEAFTSKQMVEQLRRHAKSACSMELDVTGLICNEAADEIERLRALLREWLAGCPAPPDWHWSFNLNIRTVNALGGAADETTDASS